MNLRPRRRDEFDLNVISFIDVLLVLLIFFIVTTTFRQSFEIGLELPQASSETQSNDKTVEVTIDAQGNFYINRQQLVNNEPATLRRALEKTAGEHIDTPLIISADGKTPHQAVITAMDAARQVGLMRLTFATQQPGKK